MDGPFARPLPGSLDLIWWLLAPLHARLAGILLLMGLPVTATNAVVELVMWGEVLAVGFAVVRLARSLRRPGRLSGPIRLAAALSAVGLIAWTLQHKTLHIHELFLRPDHLVLAGAVGLAIDPMSAARRRALLAALSATFLATYYGLLPLAVVVGAGLLGLGAARLIGPARRTPLIAAQIAVVAIVLGVAFWLRSNNLLLGIALHGLAFFMLLRHVSWAVEFAGGVAPNLVDYCHYLLFYPGAAGMIGAPEVFAEFRQRNLVRPPVQIDAGAVMRLARGVACIWLARRIPVSLQAVMASPDFLTVWTLQAIYWVEVALFFMGIWVMVDTVALLLGVRLRQNFAHLLSNENPSDLWRSVRATMTYWLVYHVYRPLGGNRGSQALHIVAALAVSVVWHLVGVPFLAIPPRLLHFAPFTLWAVITAAALTGHVHARRRGWRLLPESTPVLLRRGIHRLLTLLLASLAVTLPAFQIGDNVERFLPFVRTLCGLAP